MINKWPKKTIQLTDAEHKISDDWMKYYFEINRSKFSRIIDWGHNYIAKQSPSGFTSTLEIGAGLGEQICYENLTDSQMESYVCVEFRDNMAQALKERFPKVQLCIADCQEHIPYPDSSFDRIIAVHVLEHLPNLPAFLKEAQRLLKASGKFLVVIPCEGGAAYSLGRFLTTKRMFEKRYKMNYSRYIKTEHVNSAGEILDELSSYFKIKNKSFYPLRIPLIDTNLCIGLEVSKY
jgi:ubiquinone/menaquinone biosynthesis C-methylase UbiE